MDKDVSVDYVKDLSLNNPKRLVENGKIIDFLIQQGSEFIAGLEICDASVNHKLYNIMYLCYNYNDRFSYLLNVKKIVINSETAKMILEDTFYCRMLSDLIKEKRVILKDFRKFYSIERDYCKSNRLLEFLFVPSISFGIKEKLISFINRFNK